MPHEALALGVPKDEQLLYLNELAERLQEISNKRYALNTITKGYSAFITDLAPKADAQLLEWGAVIGKTKGKKWHIERKNGLKNESVAGHLVIFEPGFTIDDVRGFNAFFDKAMSSFSFYEVSFDTQRPAAGGKVMKMINDKGQLVPRLANAGGVVPTTAPYNAKFATAPQIVKDTMACLHKAYFEENPKANPPALGCGILGQMGPNFAVDPILTMTGHDGKLYVLSGKRPTGEWAFPGGMMEEAAFNSATNEFIEECCRGSLFEDKDDQTLALGSTGALVNAIEPAAFAVTLREYLLGAKGQINGQLKKLAPIQTAISDVIDNKEISNNQKIVAIRKLIGESQEIKDIDRHHLQVRTDCLLFQGLLKDQYATIREFLKVNLTEGPESYNATDPRNGETRYMVTKRLYGQTTEEAFKAVLAKSGLQMKAGDDLLKPGLVPVEVFVSNAYCDHSRLLVESLHDLVNNNQLELTEPMLLQLQIIEEAVVRAK